MSELLSLNSPENAFESSGLSLGGLVPLSSSDFPGNLSAVLFCRGCPLRCRYCHNPHLQEFGGTQLDLSDVYRFLSSRIGLLDAVVFSGGEASYQRGLLDAITAVRKLGFKIGLHTAAPSHELLNKTLPHLDWVGLDVKALPDDYEACTGVADSGKDIIRSIRTLTSSNLSFEVRTTVHSSLIGSEKLLALARLLADNGVTNYAIQLFRTKGCLDQELNESPTRLDEIRVEEISKLFPQFTLRDA